MRKLYQILIACGLSACASVTPKIEMTPKVSYKKTMKFKVDGEEFRGVAVVKYRPVYKMTISSRKKNGLDYLSFRSCNRDMFVQNQGTNFDYTYSPLHALEDKAECPVFMSQIDEEGKNSFGIMIIEHPEFTMRASKKCNGVEIETGNVSACQARVGSIQEVTVEKTSNISMSAPCKPGAFTGDQNRRYRYVVPEENCSVLFKAFDGSEHLHLIFGYQENIID